MHSSTMHGLRMGGGGGGGINVAKSVIMYIIKRVRGGVRYSHIVDG